MKRLCNYEVVSSIGKHYVVIVPVADIMNEDKFKRHDNQRDHVYRVDVQKKIHLTNKEKTWFDHEIFAGYMANGKFYLLDGHSRRYAWKKGVAKAPEFVFFHCYDLGYGVTEEQRQAFANEHYGHFNSKEGGKTAADDKAEIYQRAGFDLDDMNDLLCMKLGLAGLQIAAERLGEKLKTEKDKNKEKEYRAAFLLKHKAGVMVMNEENAVARRVSVFNGGYAAGLLFCLEWLNENDQQGYKVFAQLIKDFLCGKHSEMIDTLEDALRDYKETLEGGGNRVNQKCCNHFIQLVFNHGLIPHACYKQGFKNPKGNK